MDPRLLRGVTFKANRITTAMTFLLTRLLRGVTAIFSMFYLNAVFFSQAADNICAKNYTLNIIFSKYQGEAPGESSITCISPESQNKNKARAWVFVCLEIKGFQAYINNYIIITPSESYVSLAPICSIRWFQLFPR